jgi:hypothetical protein
MLNPVEIKSSRVWLGIVLTALGCPGTCGCAGGLMLGEKQMPNGRIGQEPYQIPLALLLGVVSLLSIVICLTLLSSRFRPVEQRSLAWFVRAAGLYPLGVSLIFVMAGFERYRLGLSGEGTLSLLSGAFFGYLSYLLIRAPEVLP